VQAHRLGCGVRVARRNGSVHALVLDDGELGVAARIRLGGDAAAQQPVGDVEQILQGRVARRLGELSMEGLVGPMKASRSPRLARMRWRWWARRMPTAASCRSAASHAAWISSAVRSSRSSSSSRSPMSMFQRTFSDSTAVRVARRKVPAPGRASTTPRVSRVASASRTAERPTRSTSARRRSGGRRSPSGTEPLAKSSSRAVVTSDAVLPAGSATSASQMGCTSLRGYAGMATR
jgi:hypothetical protein